MSTHGSVGGGDTSLRWRRQTRRGAFEPVGCDQRCGAGEGSKTAPTLGGLVGEPGWGTASERWGRSLKLGVRT